MQKQEISNLELWLSFNSEKDEVKKHILKNKLIELYYPLVQKISYRIASNLNWHVSPEELCSMGVDGLYSAIERFSVNEGVDFPAFANLRISGSMVDHIRRNDTIPRSVRAKSNLIENARIKLESQKGRKIYDTEIIEELGIDQKDYLKNTKKYQPINFVSLDGTDVISDKNNSFKKDFISEMEDKKTQSPEEEILRKEFINKLISKNFTKTEQKIIYYYYYRNLTMEEISDKLKMSESRISQLHSGVIPRLKDKIKRNPEFFGKNEEEILINVKNDKKSLF